MPTAAGTSTFTAQVADAESPPQVATEHLSITVVTPLILGTSSLLNAVQNVPYAATLAASGGTAPYTWSVTAGALPPGLTLSATGAIAGTPTAAGASTFTLQVADAESTPQKATAQVSITVVVPLNITTTSLPNGTVNTAYLANLAATGGVTPYSWMITSGALPPGLTLSATGEIAGTANTAGTFAFAVDAADTELPAQNATAQLSITIDTRLSIATTSLLSGTLNAPYAQTLTATGGAAPYTWSLASGSLPSGLSLSATGGISGAPTASGTFSFTVRVSDAESPAQTATQPLSIIVSAVSPVTTQHYDNSRTGQNVNETVLSPSTVSSGQFGKLFSVAVDGKLYAQPLYVPNVNVPGRGIHNVLFVATEHDSVYALDADSNTGGDSTPLWQVSFIDPTHGVTPFSSGDVSCDTIGPEIGITSTPVIDPVTGTLYVLANTKENGSFFQRLHALDITTGAAKSAPAIIVASYPGTGGGSSGGEISFDPLRNNNRSGLLLAKGEVYVAWASYCDYGTFQGWTMAYDATTLQQKAVWATTPNGIFGGIWMGGAGVAADVAGKVFLATGNGTFDTSGTPVDFGDSIVRLELSGNQLAVADSFTPYDQGNLSDGDLDVASGGVLLLPDQPGNHVHELVQAGKEGSIYLVDRDHMGGFQNGSNSQIVQNITNQIGGIFGMPAYWNNNVYFGGVRDNLKAFSVTNGLLSSTPTSESPTNFGYPGPTPVISSNGTHAGIVWALQESTRLDNGNAVLRAYDATNLNIEFYDTAQNDDRDNPGPVVYFAVPTVINGKVYVGAANQVSVYGLLQQH
jgi:hypothetical protein